MPYHNVSNGTSLITSQDMLFVGLFNLLQEAKKTTSQYVLMRRGFVFLTQIQSFFFMAGEMKQLRSPVSEKDYEASENEEALATLQNEVLEHIQPKHPVMYDGYNLCELITSQKVISKFKISKLSEICRLFKLEVPAQQGTRKAPFVGALTTMVLECSCYHSTTSSVSP